MSSTVPCRRRFLEMAVLGVAAAGCGSGVDSTQSGSSAPSADGGPPGAPGDVAAGNVSDLSVGSLGGLGSAPIAIGRDSAGVYAMTLVCTHAGCDGEVTGLEVVCPCHGSTFDAIGNVVHGPAPAALVHFAVSADAAGNLTVHTHTLVDPTTRLSV